MVLVAGQVAPFEHNVHVAHSDYVNYLDLQVQANKRSGLTRYTQACASLRRCSCYAGRTKIHVEVV